MYVLIFNCGSSSIKFQLIQSTNYSVIAKGILERIGLDKSKLTFKTNNHTYEIKNNIHNHEAGAELIFTALTNKEYAVLSDLNEITVVGHRVVHGGEKYSGAMLINNDVEKEITACSQLAPLHNPANLTGIKACKNLLKGIPQVAVFDTAFHQSIPDFAYRYAIPEEYYREMKIRKYGFHGTSHKYVFERACQILKKKYDTINAITCHLGNGASITAIRQGKSVDTSMGFTPLAGVIMGTRCGDVDPSITTYLMKTKQSTASDIDKIMNKQSGLLGITGISSDMRDIIKAAFEKNDLKAKLALQMYSYSIKKYIGSYLAALNRVEAIIFTGGIGENGSIVREMICSDLENLGIKLDKTKNNNCRKEAVISCEDSNISLLVIPTDEELAIALESIKVIQQQ